MSWKLCDTDWNHWPDQVSDHELWHQSRKLGLAGIELGVYRTSEQLPSDRLNSLSELVRSTGIPVSGVLLSLTPERWPNGALTGEVDDVVNEVDALCQISSRLGLSVLGVWPGADPESSDPQILRRGIEKVSRAASRHGIRIAFEYKPDTALRDAQTTLKLIEGVANAGVLVDTGHAYALGEDPAEVIRGVSDAGKLWHLHLGDAGFGGADDDLPVGRLHNADGYLSALQDVGYSGYGAFDLYGAVEGGGFTGDAAVSESLAAVHRFAGYPESIE